MAQDISHNPFFDAAWNTPFELPRFSAIKAGYYGPAFDRALAEHCEEIAGIADNPAAPDFANTVATFERSGALLRRVSRVFWNLSGSNTNEALQKIERDY